MITAQLRSARVLCSTLLLFCRFSFLVERDTFAVLLKRALQLTGEPPRGGVTPANRANVVQVVRRALWLARLLDYRSRPDCLPRALAAFVVLRRQGVPATLRVGARKSPFSAHAWVEIDGRCVTDRSEEWQLYQPMLTVP